jgi:phosphate/sulfate permease
MENNIDQTIRDAGDSSESISILKIRRAHVVDQLRLYSYSWVRVLLAAIIGAAFVVGMFLFTPNHPTWDLSRFLAKFIAGSAIGIFTYVYVIFLYRFNLSSRLKSIEIKLIKAGADELQENIEENFFTKLVQINFKYLDQYYLQTQEQADKSFRLSVAAAIGGLIIVGVGISMMYYGRVAPAYVTTGAGVISEFIAAIFFYLYNKTILKMSEYHQKLVLTQNISLALKITDEMDASVKNKSLEILIDRLTIDVNKYLSDTKA